MRQVCVIGEEVHNDRKPKYHLMRKKDGKGIYPEEIISRHLLWKENRPVPPNSDQVLYSDINLRLSGLWLFPVWPVYFSAYFYILSYLSRFKST